MWKVWVNQFIFVGRLDKLKGIDLLLKAWEKMGEDAPKLIVCGTGPMEEWCKAYVADNELNIEMRGFVSNVEARKEISRSIALVLPTQLYEGFPMGIVEAFSVGTPVLCSDLGNAGSAVEENVTGYKFNQTSEREIINAIKKMGSTSLDNKKIINIFNQKYSMDANYSILDSIYDFKFD